MSDRDVDVFCCVLIEVADHRHGDPSPVEAHWSPGPLPLSLPRTEGARAHGAGDALLADRAARESHFSQRVCETLFGHQHDGSGRWHWWVPGDAPQPVGFRILAWERLDPPATKFTSRAWFVAHIQIELGGGAEETAHQLIQRDAPSYRALRTALPSTGRPHVRHQLVSHLTWDGPAMPSPPGLASATKSWTLAERWAWSIGTGVDSRFFPPAADGPVPGQVVELSDDWVGRVFREGLALVATTPRGADGVHALLRAYARSLYLDAFLLSRLQVVALHAFADELACGTTDELGTAKVRDLQGQFLTLRRSVWWTSLSKAGRIVDLIVDGGRREWNLDELYKEVVSDLDDVARYVEAAEAETHRAEKERREVQTSAVTLLLTLVSTLLLPWSLAFTMVSVAVDPSWFAFWSSLGVSVVITTLLLAVLPGLRPSKHDIQVLLSRQEH